jgi:hypothetical protein
VHPVLRAAIAILFAVGLCALGSGSGLRGPRKGGYLPGGRKAPRSFALSARMLVWNAMAVNVVRPAVHQHHVLHVRLGEHVVRGQLLATVD